MSVERIAVPIKEKEDLDSTISPLFARAPYFTIITLEDNVIKNIETITNKTIKYPHGAGPILAKTLIEAKVNKVVAKEIGPTVLEILQQEKVEIIKTDKDKLKNIIEELKK